MLFPDCLLDTGAQQKLGNLAILLQLRQHPIKQESQAKLKLATKKPLPIKYKTLYYVRCKTLHTSNSLLIEPNLSIDMHLGTSMLDWIFCEINLSVHKFNR